MSERKTVFIVGGGYAGISCAKELDKDFNVFLIDRKEYFLHNVGALRGAVVPDFANNILIPYSSLLKSGAVICAEVIDIDKTSIQVHGVEKRAKFDYLVIATGSAYAFPSKIAHQKVSKAKEVYANSIADLKTRSKVLIIGGGAVGIELSGEIKAAYPDKSVTLLHHGKKLMNSEYPDKFRDLLLKKMNDRGIVVKLATEAKDPISQQAINGLQSITLSNGESLQVDQIFQCIGTEINQNSYKANFPVDERGCIKVNEFLQVEGQTNIFAIGDCASIPAEEKMAFFAEKHAGLVAKNLNLLAQKKPMKSYTAGGFGTMIVPIGPNDGVTLLFGCTMGGFVTKNLKSKSLFCEPKWGLLNNKFPNGRELENSKFSLSSSDLPTQHLPASVLDSLRPARAKLGIVGAPKEMASAEEKPVVEGQTRT